MSTRPKTKAQAKKALSRLWKALDGKQVVFSWPTDEVLAEMSNGRPSSLRQPREALQSLGRRFSDQWNELEDGLKWSYQHGVFWVRRTPQPDEGVEEQAVTSAVQPVRAQKSTSITTWSGHNFDIYNPDPSQVYIEDLAQAMEREQRFANQTNAPYELHGPATVGAHCCRVARYGWYLWPEIGKAMGPFEDPGPRDQIECALAFLLHDGAEAYKRDKPGPQKTPEDEKIERAILKAILQSLDPECTNRLLGWIYSPARDLADKLAEAQEALLFHPAGTFALPPEGLYGLSVTRSLLVETLPLFWPRRGESWLDMVLSVQGALRRLKQLREKNHEAQLLEVECALNSYQGMRRS